MWWIIIAALIGYLVLAAYLYAEVCLPDYAAMWWPITLAKFLGRTLWQAITSGWR